MLRFCDPGGRMYTSAGTSNANLLAWWTTVNSTSGTWSVSAGNGRTTGSCLRFTGSAVNGNNAIIRTLDAQATWGTALAFNNGTQTAVSTGQGIMGWRDAGSDQFDLRIFPDGTLKFTRAGTVVGSASTVALAASTWYHVEAKVTIHGSAGAFECRVNGVTVIGPTTGQNTRATANNSANQPYIANTATGAGTGGNFWSFDDVVFWDAQATDANGFADIHDFIGDCGVAWLLPTGAGTTTQFTPDSGANWARVSEATPDGDTSYVEDATVGHIDTYATADLPAGVVTVKSLAVVNYAKKNDVGSRGMKAEVRSAGANAAHATEIALSNSYLYYASVFGQDPNNGSATSWTPTSVNALEIGQTVSS